MGVWKYCIPPGEIYLQEVETTQDGCTVYRYSGGSIIHENGQPVREHKEEGLFMYNSVTEKWYKYINREE